MDRIHENQILGVEEYLLEYSWLIDDPNNKFNQILARLVDVLKDEHENWKNKKIIDELVQLEMGEPKQKKRKNKKKKNSKKTEEKSEKESSEKDEEQSKQKDSKQQSEKETKIQQKQSEEEEKEFEKQLKQKQIILFERESEEEEDERSQQIEEKQVQNQQLSEEEYLDQRQEAKIITKQLLKSPYKNKRKVKKRMNDYLTAYSQQIMKEANTYQKYRKVIFKIIQQYLASQLNIKGEWRLQLYGSSAAGYALKQSDIDLVILADTNLISLKYISQCIQLKEWALNCKFISSSTVSIIKFQINLMYCELALQKLKQKSMKKIDGCLFQVDLTLSDIRQKHTGIQNTQNLKNIFEKNPNIWTTCILFKELLKCKKMNKPFQGGISSYVLVMMIYNVLKLKSLHNQTDYYRQIIQLCQYIAHKFVPFKKIISSTKEPIAKINPNLHLNVEDPTTKTILTTSAFKIQEIQQQLSEFANVLFEVQKVLQEMNIDEKKKMKNFFMDSLHEYFYKEETQKFLQA